ncbi:MAG: DUF4114 domain-containing protein [Nitrospirota bacterium]|nr:DUF4114 domain-containing protein [Nitrospirota bacterium]MDH5587042.1 DUF4114 domain-containing protein [Nitrospirota bacterium]MDH5774892.1 DUF4114 domain-containing protein [Nitrospirota bacterium]
MKQLLIKSTLLPFSLALALLILPNIAQANGILGGSVIVKDTGDVTVTFQGSNAGYTSTLYFGGQALFSSNEASGTSVTLNGFEAGQVLTFSILVQETGHSFSTGSGSLNADGIAHAMVSNLEDGGTLVSFEDLYGGGDKDYNDLMFSFSNTNSETKLVQNPEPGTIILFGSGLLGLGAWRLRKKQA